MKFRKLAMALSLLTFSAIAITSEAADRADRRQIRQRARIQNGLQSDEITKGEAHRLRQSARAVRRAEHRIEKDGVVTDKEKARLEKMQDARSRQIYRVKHNDNKPGQNNQTPVDNSANAPIPSPEPAVSSPTAPESQ